MYIIILVMCIYIMHYIYMYIYVYGIYLIIQLKSADEHFKMGLKSPEKASERAPN